MKWFWGLIIIAIGIIVLGQNLSYWTTDQISQLTIFWPLLLVLFGVSLVFRKYKFGWVVILIVFLASLFVIFDSLSANPIVMSNQIIKREETKIVPVSVEKPTNISKAKINIKAGAVSLGITGNSDKLLTGEVKSNNFTPTIDTQIVNNEAIIDFKTDKFSNNSFRPKNVINLELTNEIPIELNIDCGASSLDVNLENVKISGLNINAGASSIVLKVGEKIENNTNVSINVGASSVKISAPKNVGVSMKTETGLSSKDFENLTKIDEKSYESANYKDAISKINFNLKTGASSIQFRTF